jgi:hypothetical protein
VISDYIKKLRRAADVLEELLTSNPFENPKAARALGKQFDATLTPKPSPLAGRKYNGAHWTQQPENHERVRLLAKGGAKAKNKARAETVAEKPRAETVIETVKGRRGAKGSAFHFAPGTHWTQRPENKAKLAKMHKKSQRARKLIRQQKAN